MVTEHVGVPLVWLITGVLSLWLSISSTKPNWLFPTFFLTQASESPLQTLHLSDSCAFQNRSALLKECRVGVALDIQPLGLQRKLYLTCLSCTKFCPDVAYPLEIIGPTHSGYESSKVIMSLCWSWVPRVCFSLINWIISPHGWRPWLH